jgi:hypothetical protein
LRQYVTITRQAHCNAMTSGTSIPEVHRAGHP